MDFGLDESQKLFDDAVRGFLRDALPLEEVRRLALANSGFDDELWRGAVSLGLAGGLVPETQGGSGTGLFEAALAAEALGYAAAPVPYMAPLVLAPLVLRAAPATNVRTALLDGIARGTVRCGAATPSAGAMSLDGDKVSGTVDAALDCAAATHLLLFAGSGRVAIVPADAAGVQVALKPSLDRTRPIATLQLDEVAADVIDLGQATTDRILDAGRIMLAADTLGAAQSMLDRAVAYAGQRQQFGRLIGSFQAIKHMCAEMTAMLEPCRSLVWYAAYVQEALPDESEPNGARLAALHAKAHLAEVGREVARMATEVHGGMGFTDLMGLHYWFKRIGFDRYVLGTPETLRREAARLQGWSEAA